MHGGGRDDGDGPPTLDGVTTGIVDAHIHQWDPLHTPREVSRLARIYRFAPGQVRELMFRRLVAQSDRELVLTPQAVVQPYEPRDYLRDAAGVSTAAGVPVDTVVHVEAGWHGAGALAAADETRWVAGLPFGVGRGPRLGAIIGSADPRDPAFGTLLDAHADASDLFRGIRFITARHPDPKVKDWCAEDGILASPAFLTGFAQLAARNLTFDAWCYSHQLRDVLVLAREYPDTTIVLDHYATPVGLFGPMGLRTGQTAAARAELLRAWRENITAIARCPNVVAKHSGLGFPPLGYGLQRSGNIGGREVLADMMGPLVRYVTEQFGPDRLVYGSNFPMDRPNASMPTIVGALLDILAPRGPRLLRKVFRDNALRVYRIDETDSDGG
ncbi:amidohydrolase family protein [Williamsia sterculiae]|uniref:Predicted metal-dependent hydrolase, TIM-barrel fold n=1 Tax=Williamsia sterculiae TaxID=1344003 RepID=A0A1N7CJT9_9NOCA|nr:amidohydrolase family protein [Williamsia sterculiae]SIR63886.1 Predicted metal-dependent hydrolase, TIM-barrel fold [Williamsia sterculiae]